MPSLAMAGAYVFLEMTEAQKHHLARRAPGRSEPKRRRASVGLMLSYRPAEPIEFPTLVLGEAGHCEVILAYVSATVGGRGLDHFALGKIQSRLIADRQHDFPELLARLHPLVRRPRVGERENFVNDRPGAA